MNLMKIYRIGFYKIVHRPRFKNESQSFISMSDSCFVSHSELQSELIFVNRGNEKVTWPGKRTLLCQRWSDQPIRHGILDTRA